MDETKHLIELLIDKKVYNWGPLSYKDIKNLYNMYFNFKGDYHLRAILHTLIKIKLIKSYKLNSRFYYIFQYNGFKYKEDKSGIVTY